MRRKGSLAGAEEESSTCITSGREKVFLGGNNCENVHKVSAEDYFLPLLTVLLLLWNPDPEIRSCGTLWSLQRWWMESAGTCEAAPTGSNADRHDIKSQYIKP